MCCGYTDGAILLSVVYFISFFLVILVFVSAFSGHCCCVIVVVVVVVVVVMTMTIMTMTMLLL